MCEDAPKTRLVLGLGNPGQRYVGTRHNVGFDVLNLLSSQVDTPLPKSKFEGQVASFTENETKVLLIWPLTYMNNSGRCAKAAADFYKIDVTKDLLVVCDDLSLPLGKLRMRPKGSAGGQKGLQDILRLLGNQDVPRLRIGIDPTPPRWETADYVLGKFRKDESPIIQQAISSAADAVKLWCGNDITYCMNQVN